MGGAETVGLQLIGAHGVIGEHQRGIIRVRRKPRGQGQITGPAPAGLRVCELQDEAGVGRRKLRHRRRDLCGEQNISGLAPRRADVFGLKFNFGAQQVVGVRTRLRGEQEIFSIGPR